MDTLLFAETFETFHICSETRLASAEGLTEPVSDDVSKEILGNATFNTQWATWITA